MLSDSNIIIDDSDFAEKVARAVHCVREDAGEPSAAVLEAIKQVHGNKLGRDSPFTQEEDTQLYVDKKRLTATLPWNIRKC